MVLIGSGALLWHAAQRQLELPLPESSMDVDPVTESEQVALLGYEAMVVSLRRATAGMSTLCRQQFFPKCPLIGNPDHTAKSMVSWR